MHPVADFPLIFFLFPASESRTFPFPLALPLEEGADLPTLHSGIICFVGSWIWPESYSFDETRLLHQVNEATEETVPAPASSHGDEKEKSDVVAANAELTEERQQNEEDSPAELLKSYRLSKWLGVGSFVILMILYVSSFLFCFVQCSTVEKSTN